MASRNMSGGGMCAAEDSDGNDEVSNITAVAATAPKGRPRVNYGDRMPFRQGWRANVFYRMVQVLLTSVGLNPFCLLI